MQRILAVIKPHTEKYSRLKGLSTVWGIAFVLLFLPVSGAASQSSRALVDQGAEALAEQQFEAALKIFDAAVQADPTDAEAVFFQGVALNRLSRWGQALEHLRAAREMGESRPDLVFEMGWSLLNVRRWPEAIVVLKLYEQLAPGRGQTSEFLGRAYYALGQYEEAGALLQESMRRDPDLSATARFFLALVARAQEDQESIRGHLSALLEEDPESPLAQQLGVQLGVRAKAAPPKAKPFRLALSLAGGYNDNVIALGKGIQLPSDISRKDAAFVQSSLNASYAWQVAPRDTVTVGYRFFSTVYETLSDFDLIDHYFYVNGSHRVRPDLTGTLRVSNQFTQVGGRNFRNQLSLRPAGVWRPFPWNAVEVAYSIASGAYFFPSTRARDRDGVRNTVAATNYFRIPGFPVTGRLGYRHVWNSADGGDFDFQSDNLIVGVNVVVAAQLRVETFYSRIWTRYDNPNSFTGFAFQRIDEADRVTAQLRWSVTDWLEIFGRYAYTTNDSNISVFTFDQNSWSGGVVFLFPSTP